MEARRAETLFRGSVLCTTARPRVFARERPRNVESMCGGAHRLNAQRQLNKPKNYVGLEVGGAPLLLASKRLQVILSIAGGLALTAVGAGVWEELFRPIVTWLRDLILTIGIRHPIIDRQCVQQRRRQ
jgi:hypothetical protein